MGTKSKVFVDLLIIHSKDSAKVKRSLSKDQRLSRDERSILECFLLIRNNKNKDGLDLALTIPTQVDPFVESMRLFLLGGCSNNLGLLKQAREYFEKGYEVIPKGSVIQFEFVFLHNLFNLAINFREIDKAGQLINRMDQMAGLNESQILNLDKCKFNFYTLSKNAEMAGEFAQKLKLKSDDFSPPARSLFALDLWDYGVIFEDFVFCFEALDMMKAQYNYVLTHNYNFMKTLLNHLLANEPIYIFENDFKDHPFLKNQLKFIRALETHRIPEARALWNELVELRPWALGKNFECLGPQTIFSLCLDKHREKLFRKLDLKMDNSLTIMEKIKTVLLTQNEISKDDLFYYLYNRRAETKDDYNRLARDIYKFKSTFKMDVSSKKGILSLLKKTA